MARGMDRDMARAKTLAARGARHNSDAHHKCAWRCVLGGERAAKLARRVGAPLRAVAGAPVAGAPPVARAAQRAGMDSLSTTLSRFRAVQEATAHNNAAIDLLHVGR